MRDNNCITCIYAEEGEYERSPKMNESPTNIKSNILKTIARNLCNKLKIKTLLCSNKLNCLNNFVTGEEVKFPCEDFNHYGECPYHTTQEEFESENNPELPSDEITSENDTNTEPSDGESEVNNNNEQESPEGSPSESDETNNLDNSGDKTENGEQLTNND